MLPGQQPRRSSPVQFGADPARAGARRTVDSFRTKCLRELQKIQRAWPNLHYRTVKGAAAGSRGGCTAATSLARAILRGSGGENVDRPRPVPASDKGILLTAGRPIGPAFPGVAGGIASAAAPTLRPRTGWNRPSRHPRERGAAAGVAHQAEDLGSRRAPRPEREHLHPPRCLAR